MYFVEEMFGKEVSLGGDDACAQEMNDSFGNNLVRRGGVVSLWPTIHRCHAPFSRAPIPITFQVLKDATYNKYANIKPPINVLTLFEFQNEEALRQVTLDFLIDGAMVIRPDGNIYGSGVTVLNLSQGTVNGGKKSAAASAAAQGDGENKGTCGVAIKLSEDHCGTELAKGTGQKLMIFNGALGDGPGGKEGYKVPIRDPTAPAVTDWEFVRLAGDGHVAGVEAFVEDEKNKGRVDEPRDGEVSDGSGGCGMCGRLVD